MSADEAERLRALVAAHAPTEAQHQRRTMARRHISARSEDPVLTLLQAVIDASYGQGESGGLDVHSILLSEIVEGRTAHVIVRILQRSAEAGATDSDLAGMVRTLCKEPEEEQEAS